MIVLDSNRQKSVSGCGNAFANVKFYPPLEEFSPVIPHGRDVSCALHVRRRVLFALLS